MIRVYTASMETHYGTNFEFLLDDPANPQYNDGKAEAALRKVLGFKKRGDGSGYWEEDPYHDAYFQYDGYSDVALPDSLRVK